MKKSRVQKGITLIALIITIVVLLILAVVAIGAVKNDGIIQYAKNARSDYQDAQDKEQGILDGYLSKLDGIFSGGNNGGGNGSSGGQTGGTLASQITAENYGDYIDYKVDLDGDSTNTTDWKIFYKDGENVYIIASEIIWGGNTAAGLTYNDSMGNYNWVTTPAYQTVTSDVVTKFKAEYGDYSVNDNGKCVSTLLNTSNWAMCAAGAEGAEAIGGPTLEMFIASYNQKSELMTDKNYGTLALSKEGTGYKVSLNGGEMNNNITLPDDGKSDTLYIGEGLRRIWRS